MEYEIQNFTKHCSTTGREFAPGEWYFSAVIADGEDLKRFDYAVEAWQGPPENAVGWWKSQVPDKTARKKQWAPNEVMLNFFDELAEQPDKQDMRYVLALLLIRRRVFRLDEEEQDAEGREVLSVYCPRRDANYTVPAVMPESQRIEQIQDELAALLQ